MVNFSTLVEMHKDGNLSEKGLDKYVRDLDKPPVISTAQKAVENGLINKKLVDNWIKDGVLPEGSTRTAKVAYAFKDKDGRLCIPSFYMKGSSRSSENWSNEMIQFKEDYQALIKKYKESGVLQQVN